MHDRQKPTTRAGCHRGPTVPGRQRGMTLWSLLYVLVTLGLIALVAVKSLPVYLNAYDVRQTIEWAGAEPDLVDASAPAIQQAIQRRFDAGYVDNLHGRDVAVTKVAGGREISVAYEVRRPLLFNVSLVYSFAERARLNGHDGQ